MHLRRRILPFAGILIFFAFVVFVFSDKILWTLGAALVMAEAPRKADMAEVLGGDYRGNRILKACELVRGGFVPKALVTGGGGFFDLHESKLSISFAGIHGCPSTFFIPLEYPALSTTDEVSHLVPELRRLGVRKLLVVTSPSHTGRAARVFRRLAPDIEVHTIAAFDPEWNNGYWWKIRQGRKTWLDEAIKTVADFFRL